MYLTLLQEIGDLATVLKQLLFAETEDLKASPVDLWELELR